MIDMEEMEEKLQEMFGDKYHVETDDDGQLIIFTGHSEGEDGELLVLSDEDLEDDDLDPEFEPYEEDDEDD